MILKIVSVNIAVVDLRRIIDASKQKFPESINVSKAAPHQKGFWITWIRSAAIPDECNRGYVNISKVECKISLASRPAWLNFLDSEAAYEVPSECKSKRKSVNNQLLTVTIITYLPCWRYGIRCSAFSHIGFNTLWNVNLVVATINNSPANVFTTFPVSIWFTVRTPLGSRE